MLFTGDLNGEQESLLEPDRGEESMPSVNILKVAHHGSKNSTTKVSWKNSSRKRRLYLLERIIYMAIRIRRQ